MRCVGSISLWAVLLWGSLGLLAACNRTNDLLPSTPSTPPPVILPQATPTPEPPLTLEGQSVRALSARNGVETVDRAGGRRPLPAPTRTFLTAGDGVDVDLDGRVLLRFADGVEIEVMRDGELTFRELALDERDVRLALVSRGGTARFDIDSRLQVSMTVETEFAQIVATGTSFLVVKELDSPLEWVIGLESEDDLQVTARNDPNPDQPTTKGVDSGVARWIAPIDVPSAGIAYDGFSVLDWMDRLENGEPVAEIGEVLWPHADAVLDTGGLAELPPPGEPFTLPFDLGQVTLILEPEPGFGPPAYRLVDCNGDGRQDIFMELGALTLDFRTVLARVRGVDVTVLAGDEEARGTFQAYDPAYAAMNGEAFTLAPGTQEVISLHSELPYHYARLTLSQGCFLGVSLTPPEMAPRPATEPSSTLAAPPPAIDFQEATARPAENGRLRAWTGLPIVVDGDVSEWPTPEGEGVSTGPGWTPLATVVYDNGCAARYPVARYGRTIPTDLAARVQFAYDEAYLYVAFVVEDDGFVGYSGGDYQYFNGDAPQLLLDLDLAGDFQDTGRSGDDRQVDLRAGVGQPGTRTAVALWDLATLQATSYPDARVAAQGVDGGYVLEAALPWAPLGIAPQPGLQLGLAASVSDNDRPEANVQQCMISTAPGRDWQDPTTWGTLLLAGPPNHP